MMIDGTRVHMRRRRNFKLFTKIKNTMTDESSPRVFFFFLQPFPAVAIVSNHVRSHPLRSARLLISFPAVHLGTRVIIARCELCFQHTIRPSYITAVSKRRWCVGRHDNLVRYYNNNTNRVVHDHPFFAILPRHYYF
uniref:Uncharacterized protein n=1 Tax=Sipha flava TaxID=143950 RepID=A0A2S2RBN8_9HEMI